MVKLIQRICLWILKKTNYRFKIEHDKIEIQVQPVGLPGEAPTRYDFVCNHNGILFMNSINMVEYFSEKDIFDCPNPKTKGVRLNRENEVKKLEQQYSDLVKVVANGCAVVI